jgi:hypothetical protein
VLDTVDSSDAMTLARTTALVNRNLLLRKSRILQVSIFNTLQRNLSVVDFSLLLIDVMTIADEVDSQLKQTIVSFMESTDVMRNSLTASVSQAQPRTA